MSGFFTILMIVAMMATLGVVIVGVISIARVGTFNQRNANKLMRLRVALQATTLLFFVVAMLFVRKG
jgi:hypothetical protein